MQAAQIFRKDPTCGRTKMAEKSILYGEDPNLTDES